VHVAREKFLNDLEDAPQLHDVHWLVLSLLQLLALAHLCYYAVLSFPLVLVRRRTFHGTRRDLDFTGPIVYAHFHELWWWLYRSQSPHYARISRLMLRERRLMRPRGVEAGKRKEIVVDRGLSLGLEVGFLAVD